MNGEEQTKPEVLSATVALLATFAATVVLHFCVMLAFFSMPRSVPFLERIVWLLPFGTMMIPGMRRLWLRRWLAGGLLLVGGGILAVPALWIALGMVWSVLM